MPKLEDGLYADGGVIFKNPSPYGGTWAFCLVKDNEIISSGSGIILPSEFGGKPVTNNVSEMYAVIKGLESLPENWSGIVYSDSQVTLGRVFGVFKSFDGIPHSLRIALYNAKGRLSNKHKIGHILVAGHPTKKELASGTGKNGNIVSRFNVWCDKECTRLSKEFLERNKK